MTKVKAPIRATTLPIVKMTRISEDTLMARFDTPIRSHIPGRVRLRSAILRRPSRNQAICETMRTWEGVVAAEGNPATESILLHYDPARSPAEIEGRIAELLPPTQAESCPDEQRGGGNHSLAGLSLWQMNPMAKLGMLGSIVGSLAALSVGKKMHVALGAMHVMFLLVHVANHRKRLLD